jgi:hypothetical protein
MIKRHTAYSKKNELYNAVDRNPILIHILGTDRLKLLPIFFSE